MKRKEQIIILEQHGAKCSVSSLFVLVFFFFVQLSFAQNTNVQYDINDPRNPNCPCHKLQKQAEEEYAKQNKQNNVQVNNKDEGQQQINFSQNDLGRSVNSSSGGSGNISGRRKKSAWVKKVKFRYYNQVNRIKKVRPDYSVCFKW